VNGEYREGIAKVFDVPGADFECPFGITEDTLPPESQLPSMLERANTLTKAVAGVVADMASGENPVVPEDSQAYRMGICNKCGFADNGVCRKCGCYLETKTKLRRGGCPIGRW
jgi:hypothetical protein